MDQTTKQQMDEMLREFTDRICEQAMTKRDCRYGHTWYGKFPVHSPAVQRTIDPVYARQYPKADQS